MDPGLPDTHWAQSTRAGSIHACQPPAPATAPPPRPSVLRSVVQASLGHSAPLSQNLWDLTRCSVRREGTLSGSFLGVSFHTDSPGSGVRLPLRAVRGECPLEPPAEKEAGRPTGAGRGAATLRLTSPDLREVWNADGSLRVSRPQDGVERQHAEMCSKCAAVHVRPHGRLLSGRGQLSRAGLAATSRLHEDLSRLACHLSAQHSCLVLEVRAFQTILRNINDWLLNQDALVA